VLRPYKGLSVRQRLGPGKRTSVKAKSPEQLMRDCRRRLFEESEKDVETEGPP
jgi:hypothetical protein